MSRFDVLAEVSAERDRQDAKWGVQSHPDGTGGTRRIGAALRARNECDEAARAGQLTYRHILEEEAAEALAEQDKAKLRAELIQVAAVAVAWVEKLDRETAQVPPRHEK